MSDTVSTVSVALSLLGVLPSLSAQPHSLKTHGTTSFIQTSPHIIVRGVRVSSSCPRNNQAHTDTLPRQRDLPPHPCSGKSICLKLKDRGCCFQSHSKYYLLFVQFCFEVFWGVLLAWGSLCLVLSLILKPWLPWSSVCRPRLPRLTESHASASNC